MKNFILFVFAFLVLSFTSCEKEEETITQNTADSFTKSNAIASLIMRVSQNETTIDNVLDNTSLFSIKLPVQILVDGHSELVDSVQYYQEIQSIKDQHNYDNDIVYFTFPLTIIYPNFQTAVVNSQSELDAIKNQMGSDENYHEINCIDFQFPFNINVYNTNNQVANTVVIDNNTELYNFVNNLTSDEIVGIVYPLTLKKTTNVQYVVNNNTELEDTIDNAVLESNSGSTTLDLHQVLTSGSWYVSYCYYDEDETNYYNGYSYTFTGSGNEGTSVAIKGAIQVNGEWDIHTEEGYQRLDLHFDGDSMNYLETEWRLQELTSTMIRLKKNSGGGQYYYLTFTKN